MARLVTHNTNLIGNTIQSYAMEAGIVVLDFNGLKVDHYQEWTADEARGIARLLTLAAADADLAS